MTTELPHHINTSAEVINNGQVQTDWQLITRNEKLFVKLVSLIGDKDGVDAVRVRVIESGILTAVEFDRLTKLAETYPLSKID